MKLIRFKHGNDAVMGVLRDDNGGTYFTIENASKAIPMGSYKVSVCHSPRFGCDLPLIVNASLGVAASRGIRIHAGNSYKDSVGCILVGNSASLSSRTIGDSQKALAQLLRCCGSTLDIVEGF